MESGVFRDEAHARNAYEKTKQETKPKTAPQMWVAWVVDNVERRILEGPVGGEEEE